MSNVTEPVKIPAIPAQGNRFEQALARANRCSKRFNRKFAVRGIQMVVAGEGRWFYRTEWK